MIPSVLVAGTHSGVGKTTVTLGLMAALGRRGLKVQPFKVGPDFIDPSHHTAICGRASRNLDTFMMGVKGVRESFCRATKGADVAVVEGVMGLYDGMDAGEVASTAHVAKVLGIPVLLVVNVHGMSRSAGAMVMGYRAFDPGVRIAGVIFNRVGSERHLSMLQRSVDLPVLGSIPRKETVSLPSRHLGLEMGYESRHDLDLLASVVEEHADLDGIIKAARSYEAAERGPLAWQSQALSRETEADGGGGRPGHGSDRVRIGVAWDEAFCFYYQDNLDLLRRMGADVVLFSPMRDRLPEVDGLYLGGGYPELYAKTLERAPCKGQIRRASEDGMPVYGECGGLIYLGRSLSYEGKCYEMAGVLPGSTAMKERFQALGYVEAEVVGANPVVEVGRSIRGHEFHYSRMECDHDARFAYRVLRGKGIAESMDGLTEYNTLGSYLHTHMYSYPVDRFIESCRLYKRR